MHLQLLVQPSKLSFIEQQAGQRSGTLIYRFRHLRLLKLYWCWFQVPSSAHQVTLCSCRIIDLLRQHGGKDSIVLTAGRFGCCLLQHKAGGWLLLNVCTWQYGLKSRLLHKHKLTLTSPNHLVVLWQWAGSFLVICHTKRLNRRLECVVVRCQPMPIAFQVFQLSSRKYRMHMWCRRSLSSKDASPYLAQREQSWIETGRLPCALTNAVV